MSAIRQLLAQIHREGEPAGMTHPVPPAEAAFVRQGRALFREAISSAKRIRSTRPLGTYGISALLSTKRRTRALYFTVYGSELNPLPPRFANVVKSYLLLNRTAVATMVLGADIARMLWEAILRRFGTADAFDWSLLVEDDLLRTEQIMLAHWSQSTTYKRCTQLQFMLRALAAAPAAVSSGPWTSRLPRPGRTTPNGTR